METICKSHPVPLAGASDVLDPFKDVLQNVPSRANIPIRIAGASLAIYPRQVLMLPVTPLKKSLSVVITSVTVRSELILLEAPPWNMLQSLDVMVLMITKLYARVMENLRVGMNLGYLVSLLRRLMNLVSALGTLGMAPMAPPLAPEVTTRNFY